MKNKTEVDNFSSTKIGLDWLEQFDVSDRHLAKELLDSVVWVSHLEFSHKLMEKITEYAATINGPVALFLERELRKNQWGVQRLYKQERKPRRAKGACIQPVESKKRYNDEVGSEGMIGTLVTGLMRDNPKKYFLHPTAEQIRTHEIRSFCVVTDTIGSGAQLSTFFDSMWKVASVKSWKSSGLIDFSVIAYTATDFGLKKILSHKLNPTVHYVCACPTVHHQFQDSIIHKKQAKIVELCEKYGKKTGVSKKVGPLGYGNTGSLIAYAHGMPNNSPRIFHKKSKRWEPIFPARVANHVIHEMNPGHKKIPSEALLIRLGHQKLSASKWLFSADEKSKKLIILMASLHRGRRCAGSISARTQLDIDEVCELLDIAKNYNWVSDKNRLTDDGRQLLSQIESQQANQQEDYTFDEKELIYFPSTLRAH